MSLVCIPTAVGVLDVIFFWSFCTAFQNGHADVNSSECVPGLSSLHLFTYYPSSLGIAILTGARSQLSVASLCVPRWLRMVNTFALVGHPWLFLRSVCSNPLSVENRFLVVLLLSCSVCIWSDI